MALLWCDGFDDIATATSQDASMHMAARYTVLGYDGTSASRIYSSTARLNGYSIRSDEATSIVRNDLPITTDTLIIGFGFQTELSTTTWKTFLSLYDGETLGVNFKHMTMIGEIAAYRGATLLGITSGARIREDAWYWVEVKVKCNDTTGTVEIRVGGAPVLTLTGIDTKAGSHTLHNSVALLLEDHRVDDLYIADTTGSLNNDFLGGCAVVHLFPTGDAGTNQWTLSAGSDHYALVDEVVQDADTTYVSSATTGQTDMWTYGDLSGVDSVLGLNVFTVCRNTDNTALSLKSVIDSTGDTVESTALAVWNVEYATIYQISETDPDTSAAWTDTAVNAASFGVKVG